MRYEIEGVQIRSENAAQSASNAAGPLVNWLQNRTHTPSALDFGCGKLRYTPYLAHKSTRLGVVDSDVQLSRIQRIGGEQISVEEYVKRKWPACRIQRLEDFWVHPSHSYHFILCANVLSAIPCPRARGKSLGSLHTALRHDGQVLFVNQHTNSYFTQIRKKPTTRPHLDGWISESRHGAAYYGILTADSVIALISPYGLAVEQFWIEGQSTYVLAMKENS